MASEESYLNSSLRKIAKGAGIGFTGLAIASVLGFGSRLVLARSLTPSEYGLISLGIASFNLLTVLGMLGMSQGVVRHVSFYKARKDKERMKGSIVSGVKISFPISLLLVAILFFGSEWVAINIFNEAELTPVLKIFAVSPPFMILARILLGATVGFEDMRYKVYVNEITQNGLRFFVIIFLMFLGFGVIGGAVGWISSILVMPILAMFFLEKRVFPILKSNIKAKSMGRELISFSLPLLFVGFSTMIIRWTDTLMLGFFLTSQNVGIYNVSLPTTRLIRMALMSLGAISMPVITGLYSQGKFEDIKDTYSAVTKWLLSLSLPLFLIIFLFSKSIIRVLFGVEYIEGATAMSILALGFFLFTLLGLSIRIINAFGRTRLNMISSFAAAGLNVLLNFILIPIYGINGAAIATATSFSVLCGLNFIFVYYIGRMQPFRLNHLKVVLASGIAVLVIYGLVKSFFTPAPAYVLVPIFIVFLILYFFLLLVLRSFEEEDLMIMRAIDRRLGLKSEWIRRVIGKFL